MADTRPGQHSSLVRLARKYFVSAFVVLSFTAYAVHERGSSLDAGDPILAPVTATDTRQTATVLPTIQPIQPTVTLPNTQARRVEATLVPTQTTAPRSATSTPVPPPTTAPLPTTAPVAAADGLYKDGQYTGSTANAFYGLVQVKAIVSGGKITDVQFLQYPHDRRTSQRINQVAIPYLRSEAIQAQNAEVDIISGATLTSEAFIESLQSALNNARS